MVASHGTYKQQRFSFQKYSMKTSHISNTKTKNFYTIFSCFNKHEKCRFVYCRIFYSNFGLLEDTVMLFLHFKTNSDTIFTKMFLMLWQTLFWAPEFHIPRSRSVYCLPKRANISPGISYSLFIWFICSSFVESKSQTEHNSLRCNKISEFASVKCIITANLCA